jgi:hypothetical protein
MTGPKIRTLDQIGTREDPVVYSKNDIGVDIGQRRIALGWPYYEQSFSLDMGKHAGPARHLELRSMADWVGRTLPAGAHLWIERPYLSNGSGMNQNTTIGMAETVAAVMLAAPWAKVDLVVPGTWKKQVCGSGVMTKAEVAAWLKTNQFRLWQKCLGDEDRMDAMCVGLYGMLRSDGVVDPPVKPHKKKKVPVGNKAERLKAS